MQGAQARLGPQGLYAGWVRFIRRPTTRVSRREGSQDSARAHAVAADPTSGSGSTRPRKRNHSRKSDRNEQVESEQREAVDAAGSSTAADAGEPEHTDACHRVQAW